MNSVNTRPLNYRQFAIYSALTASVLNLIVYLIGSAAGASFVIN